MFGIFYYGTSKIYIGGVKVANAKILAKKQEVIDEIKSRVQDNATVVLFDYRGITDSEAKELRKALKEA